MTNNGVPELSKKEFDSYISKGIVVIDFFAEWCMPCLMMAPVIEELSEKFKGKIKFGKVNVDDNQELSGKFKVQSIPNLIVFKDGKQINQIIGGVSAEELEDRLNKFL
jgi:thioredoxin 1